jgi:hypothetical protein
VTLTFVLNLDPGQGWVEVNSCKQEVSQVDMGHLDCQTTAYMGIYGDPLAKSSDSGLTRLLM